MYFDKFFIGHLFYHILVVMFLMVDYINFKDFGNYDALIERVTKGTRLTGTREWACMNLNCALGCACDCRYCYARIEALRRKRINAFDDWKFMKPLPAVLKNFRHVDHATMFPSTHDIIPTNETYPLVLEVIKRQLQANNKLLITSKPRIRAIRDIIDLAKPFKKELIIFRFTITTLDESLAKWIEPGAPSISERLESAKFAFESGYKVTFSIEPCLENPIKLIELISRYSDEIWLGVMNRVYLRWLKHKIDPTIIEHFNRINAEITRDITEISCKQKVFIKDTLATLLLG